MPNYITQHGHSANDAPPTTGDVEAKKGMILVDRNNYIVRRRPDHLSSWNFQIYRSRVQEFSTRNGSSVVAVCDNETNQEKVFVVSLHHLMENILPRAYHDEKGRYLFEINKQTFKFNWHHSIEMDGNQFLLK